MSAVATAIVGAAVVGGVASSMAASKQAKAANNAANLQAQSESDSLALQKEMFDKQVELNQPWQDAGLKALDNYANNPAFSFSYNDLTADPSYKFRQQQGVNAMDMSAASKGKILSGAQDKALANYGQNLASEEYQNAYARALQGYNTNANTQLNVANLGRGATGQTANAAQNYANSASNTMANSANSQAQRIRKWYYWHSQCG
jgi:hypothetical protein